MHYEQYEAHKFINEKERQTIYQGFRRSRGVGMANKLIWIN